MFPMKHLTTPSLSILIAASAFAQSAPAAATAWSQTHNVALSTDYVFRGISQNGSSNGLSISGGTDIAHTSGFSVGFWASNQNVNEVGNESIEADVYAAFAFKLGAVDMSLGGISYFYPGASDFNTSEVNLGAAYAGLSLKASYALTKYFNFNDSEGTTYVDLSYSYTFSSLKDLAVGLHYGWTLGEGTQFDYEDYNVGLSYPLLGYTASLAYTDANALGINYTGKVLDKGIVVFSMTKSF